MKILKWMLGSVTATLGIMAVAAWALAALLGPLAIVKYCALYLLM